jgi:hypothetical protein
MERDLHLSRISTIWTDVLDAHGDDASAVRSAQNAIMERYSVAIHRYLCKVLGNSDAADEVFQQFALQFVRRTFRNADPQRGRFRDYIKISILNLVTRYRREQVGRGAVDMERLADEPIVHSADDEAALTESLRDELLSRAWIQLRDLEDSTGTPFHLMLRLRVASPDATSEVLAERLGQALSPPRAVTAAGARKILERARLHMAQFVLDEVAKTLETPSRDELVEETRQLGLYPYCRKVLDRR